MDDRICLSKYDFRWRQIIRGALSGVTITVRRQRDVLKNKMVVCFIVLCRGTSERAFKFSNSTNIGMFRTWHFHHLQFYEFYLAIITNFVVVRSTSLRTWHYFGAPTGSRKFAFQFDLLTLIRDRVESSIVACSRKERKEVDRNVIRRVGDGESENISTRMSFFSTFSHFRFCVRVILGFRENNRK